MPDRCVTRLAEVAGQGVRPVIADAKQEQTQERRLGQALR